MGAARAGARSAGVGAIGGVYLFAIVLWAGGLVVLGAIVAPTVFRIVPAPTSADAMTVVFRRFDRVVMACSAVALLCEAALARFGGRITRLDLARGLTLVLATALGLTVGAHLSPTIEALHRAGAVRGLGDGGLALERAHRLAEAAAKGELLLLTVGLALLVARLVRPNSGGDRSVQRLR